MRFATITGCWVLACFVGAAQAQVYCWNTKDGKRVCGDTPPAGAKTTTITTPAPASPASGAASKDARKGPLTPAEQEQAYRKRQAEAQKAREKDEQAQRDAALKKENCARAREALRVLESGQRLAGVDSKGERYYFDDEQIARETERARQTVQQSCE